MTAAAIKTELTVVDVIGAMTVCATAAESRLPGHRASMAAFAGHVPMCTIKNEAGLGIVIELPLRPIDGVVAKRTIVVEAPCVRIDFAMAFDTAFGCVVKHLCLVAGIALRFGMRPE